MKICHCLFWIEKNKIAAVLSKDNRFEVMKLLYRLYGGLLGKVAGLRRFPKDQPNRFLSGIRRRSNDFGGAAASGMCGRIRRMESIHDTGCRASAAHYKAHADFQ